MIYYVDYIVKTEIPSKQKDIRLLNKPKFSTDEETHNYVLSEVAAYEQLPKNHIRIVKWIGR